VIKALDEHERTMAFAEVALGQIKSLRQTAVPRNYEIWYVYATGYNSPLNKIINETLARNGKLTESDLEQIYETYLSQIKTTDRIDKVGARVIGEIDDVMKLITEALGMSASYDRSLSGATQKLAVAQNPDQVKAVIESLVTSTHEMRETNRALEDRLTLSKSEAEPRGDPGRKPDRSPHRPWQPQIFRPLDRNRGAECARHRRAAFPVDVRHRPLQIIQRLLRPPDR
jgi:diguanylate cyclase